MARYVLRRFAFLLISLALASVVLFVLLRMLPGDPANALTAVGATDEQIAAARASIGSDRPLPEQFVHWIGQLVRGDLGTSFVSSLPVGPEVTTRLQVTLPLTLAAFVLAVLIAVPAGFLAAHKRRTWYGALLNGVSQLGIAIPVFWLGMILIVVLAVNARWFPAGGFPPDGWTRPGEAVRSLVLPVITIALVMSASLIRYVRSATLDVLDSDHLRTARALGSSFGGAMWRHGLRNASVPVISVLGIELASTLLGAVVVESVFALPGLGSLLTTGITQHDYPVIQGVLFVSTLAVLLIGFAADLVQRIVDPRLRAGLSGGPR
ncbi:ABC transporter permease [Streptomyces yaizuensis]|uniref:ABC transporter permease n=1 Tax=Streptomyces yaizuensis TaxID=2989713 RepID=A0ABQ5NRH3_9ACTN|nr:ABC transporter permease [Streptomyces sp. YSPA8]GLF92872.1 ABC transporter permease [Streptomyces sp. YSPA8]